MFETDVTEKTPGDTVRVSSSVCILFCRCCMFDDGGGGNNGRDREILTNFFSLIILVMR